MVKDEESDSRRGGNVDSGDAPRNQDFLDPMKILKEVFGYDSLRPNQLKVVRRMLRGKDTIVLMPTGGGKSLCYQLPGLCRSGTGLVISPLIALMNDQVADLKQNGVGAECLHSGLSPKEQSRILNEFVRGRLDLLYVAPERAQQDGFQALLRKVPLAVVAVDEAHCVDKWGHDFREDYLGLHTLRAHMNDTPWLACTATADDRSLEIIRSELQMSQAQVVRGTQDRPNLYYCVIHQPARAKEMFSWIASNYHGEAGIIYCRSRNRTEELSSELRHLGLNAIPYHAGLPPEERRAVEQRFRMESGLIVVATIAFGMGIDRSNVRFVIHAEPPDSLDAYVQEAGRAGRDDLAADARLYNDRRTIGRTVQNLDSDTGPETRAKKRRFQAFLGYLESSDCRRTVLLGYFGEKYPGSCGRCDNCTDPPEIWDAREAAMAFLEAVEATGSRFGTGHVIDFMTGKETAKIQQRNHHLHPAFGKSPWSLGELQILARYLIARGVLRSDRYGGLRTDGTPLPPGPIRVRKPLTGRTKTAPPRQRTRTVFTGTDQGLWDRLRQKRLEIARQANVPAFVVFNDVTLKQMVELKPTNDHQFLSITGIGQVKLLQYGEMFMEIIREHIAG